MNYNIEICKGCAAF